MWMLICETILQRNHSDGFFHLNKKHQKTRFLKQKCLILGSRLMTVIDVRTERKSQFNNHDLWVVDTLWKIDMATENY